MFPTWTRTSAESFAPRRSPWGHRVRDARPRCHVGWARAHGAEMPGAGFLSRPEGRGGPTLSDPRPRPHPEKRGLSALPGRKAGKQRELTVLSACRWPIPGGHLLQTRSRCLQASRWRKSHAALVSALGDRDPAPGTARAPPGWLQPSVLLLVPSLCPRVQTGAAGRGGRISG